MLGLMLFSVSHVINAYGHGVQSGPMGRPVRVDNEQFSANQVDTGGFITITGTVRNVSEQQFELLPYILIDRTELIESDGTRRGQIPFYHSLLTIIYPPYKDPASWYFKVEHSLTSPFPLQSGDQVDFEIRAYPLKSGAYHVHSYFISDEGAFIGRGQTIVVTGSASPTVGEISELYLPFAIGLAAAVVLILRAVLVSRKHNRAERVVRIFFAAKSSFETVWLTGILFWLATASYLVSLEARYTLVLLTSAALASITFGGYAASTIKSRSHYLKFAVGTSIATAVFYFILTFSNTLDQYKSPQFGIDGFISFVAIVASVLVAAYLLILLKREKGRVNSEKHLARS